MTQPHTSRRLAHTLLSAFLLFYLCACSSMRTVNVENAMLYAPPPGIHAGTLVEVKTIGGETLDFRVTEVTEEGLHGEPGFIRYADMRSLKAEKPPESKTEFWPIVLGILGIVAVVALVSNADSVRVCSGTPCSGPEPEPH
ncbi:hypothetical protein F3N42_13435 [Marinihelvus fidelis]|uniref:Uncharacterized protein n=1 Tax=Marinihelvus fidelis TaxID=2613842 RepID=A0A5N0T5W3_9GAMM|nr:hypothetical protein [Marinihelvus fidelis]KAA9130168.1 hypothetical protein F3N42_13435 [Marinihelvus fidelis]